MTLIYIDLKTTAVRFVSILFLITYLLFVIIQVSPILLFAAIIWPIEKIVGHEIWLGGCPDWMNRWADWIEITGDRYVNWVGETFTTEKEQMWLKLCKPIEEVEKDEE